MPSVPEISGCRITGSPTLKFVTSGPTSSIQPAFSSSSAVVRGSIWQEDIRGTNALGLSIATRRASVVDGGEHYLSRLDQISCFACPVRNSRNEVVGVIDASTDARARQRHTLALVKLASVNVENRLFRSEHAGALVLGFHPRQEYLNTTSAASLKVQNQLKPQPKASTDARDPQIIAQLERLAENLSAGGAVFCHGPLGSGKSVVARQILRASPDQYVRPQQVAPFLSTEDDEVQPCPTCVDGMIKRDKCMTIRRTWLQNDGNVSLVSRKLRLSRTTIYAHLPTVEAVADLGKK